MLPPASDFFRITGSELVVKTLSFGNLVMKRIIQRELKPFIHPKNQKKILDLGCGTGSFANLFSPRVYTGVDISQAAVSLAQRKKPYTFFVMDARHLSFKPNTFSAILIAGVLHHLSDKDVHKVCREMVRVLKPKGEVLIIEAMRPLLWFNFVGWFVRALDAGRYIREPQEYQAILRPHFSLVRSYTTLGGVFDYVAFRLRGKNKVLKK